MKFIVTFLLVLLCNLSFSQRDLKSKALFTPIFGLTYKANFTGKDLAKMWGFNNQVGAEVGFKLKNSLEFGIDGGFIFGKKFKDTLIFKDVYTSNNAILSNDGFPADVFFYMRGANINAHIGYVFNKLGHNPNSGLWVNAGVGFMGYKIRVETQDHVVPQLENDILWGYDHLTMGFTTKQFIGYLFQHDRKFVNFYLGVEFVQGYTHNVRNYNFDVKGPLPEDRLDLMYSIKFGWMIPIYKRHDQEFYYN